METKTTDVRYKHPKVALCRQCGGMGFTTQLDEREENEISKTCPVCRGSGRVVVSAVMHISVRPYVQGERIGG